MRGHDLSVGWGELANPNIGRVGVRKLTPTYKNVKNLKTQSMSVQSIKLFFLCLLFVIDVMAMPEGQAAQTAIGCRHAGDGLNGTPQTLAKPICEESKLRQQQDSDSKQDGDLPVKPGQNRAAFNTNCPWTVKVKTASLPGAGLLLRPNAKARRVPVGATYEIAYTGEKRIGYFYAISETRKHRFLDLAYAGGQESSSLGRLERNGGRLQNVLAAVEKRMGEKKGKRENGKRRNDYTVADSGYEFIRLVVASEMVSELEWLKVALAGHYYSQGAGKIMHFAVGKPLVEDLPGTSSGSGLGVTKKPLSFANIRGLGFEDSWEETILRGAGAGYIYISGPAQKPTDDEKQRIEDQAMMAAIAMTDQVAFALLGIAGQNKSWVNECVFRMVVE